MVLAAYTENFTISGFAWLTKVSCAAKYKSRKALRNERALFDQLREMNIYTTDTVTTHIVLQLKTGPLKVQSDRSFLHHEVIDGQLRIYIPEDRQQRRACYRTHLPRLLASITGTSPTAIHDISTILSSTLGDLDDILIEQDISDVSWIEKPVIDLSELQEDERPSIPTSSNRDVNFNVASGEPGTDAGLFTPRITSRASSERSSRTFVEADFEDRLSIPSPSQYRRLVEQIIRCAQRTPNRDVRVDPIGEESTYFDRVATFGIRETNEFAYNRRVGAAGEAFVSHL